jgi:hypothetical protein
VKSSATSCRCEVEILQTLSATNLFTAFPETACLPVRRHGGHLPWVEDFRTILLCERNSDTARPAPAAQKLQRALGRVNSAQFTGSSTAHVRSARA